MTSFDLPKSAFAAHRSTARFTAPVTIASLVVLAAIGCSKKEAPKPEPEKTMASVAPKASAAMAPPPAALPDPPDTLPKLSEPEDNPRTAAKVALGQKLFFDKRLSVDGSVACISCHENADGTGGHDPTAIGAGGKALTRHSPTLWNIAYLPALYWDGRAPNLEAQMKGAWGGGNMGVGKDNLDQKADEIAQLPEYAPLFEKAFPGIDATADHVAQAVASYERTLFCGETAYDKFFKGEAEALTAEQKAGWGVFSTKGGCINCHTPPFFSDAYLSPKGAYHNAGIGIKGVAEAEVDPGRGGITKEAGDWGAFKTPSLRNVSKSAPYFHDGSVKDLESAVRFMAGGGFKNKNLDEKLQDKRLTDEEIAQVVAFLGALECEGELQPPK